MMTLICFSLLLSLTCVAVLYHQHKQLSALTKTIDQFAKMHKQYQSEQSALVHADLVFSKQLIEINRQLVSQDDQLQNLENIRNNDGSYQHALKILEMGGNKEEIIKSCHLSKAEAELLMNLNAYQLVMKGSSKSRQDVV